MQFVPECYKTHEMCKKIVDFCPFVIGSVADCCKTQEICDKVASEGHFMLKYWFDRYRTQEMCDKAVAASLSTLKFILDLFVTKKWFKNLLILYFVMTTESLLIKIVVISHFLVMKLVLLM